MKKFLVHSERHEYVVIDISKIETSNVDFRHGNQQIVPAFRFTKKEAEEYLRANGATEELLELTKISLSKTGVAVLTIV